MLLELSGIEWLTLFVKIKKNYHRNLINRNYDPKHAWKAINNILNRKSPKSRVSNLKVNDKDVVMPNEVSDCFNK